MRFITHVPLYALILFSERRVGFLYGLEEKEAVQQFINHIQVGQ